MQLLQRIFLLLPCLISFPAAAATFETLVEHRSGEWTAALLRNQQNNRVFCAVESYDGETVLRVVRYKDDKDTFLEIHNRSWNLLEGSSGFTLAINISDEIFRAELMGRRYSDGYTHTFTDGDKYLTLLGMLARAKSVVVQNPNGATIATFNGQGSGAAVRNYDACAHGDISTEEPQHSSSATASPEQIHKTYSYSSGNTIGTMTVTDMSACEQRKELGCMSAARPLRVQIQTRNREAGNDCNFEAIEETSGRIEDAKGLTTLLVIQDERSKGKPNLSITFDKSSALVEQQPEAFAIGCGTGVGYDGLWQLR